MSAIDVSYLLADPEGEEPLAKYTFGELFGGQEFELLKPGQRQVWQEMLYESAMTTYARFLNDLWEDRFGDIKECEGNPFEIARRANKLDQFPDIEDAYLTLCRRILECYLGFEKPYALEDVPSKWVLAVKQDAEDKLNVYAASLRRESSPKGEKRPPESD